MQGAEAMSGATDITHPNECAVRGLRALREYVIAAMEPDDSQQYLDYCAALDWMDRTLANLCEHCDGTKPCVHCGSDPL